MAFFFLRMLHLKIHSVFQLQFFISSTFYLRCIKLATQSCSSELARLVILSIQFPGNGQHQKLKQLLSLHVCRPFIVLDFLSLYVCTTFFFVKHLVKIILCYCVSFDIGLKIGKLEDTRNRTLHGILRVQSCFRGHQARHHARERIRGVLALQSCKFSQITILTYFTFYSC